MYAWSRAWSIVGGMSVIFFDGAIDAISFDSCVFMGL